MWTTSAIGLILAGYLLGSLSPSFLAARALKGIDLRRYGSGNVGSSNVGIQLGRAWTIALGVGDLLKGFLPCALARVWGFDWGIVALAGIAAVIGHDWSLYLGFTGGRGMATMIGALCAWDARLVIALLCVIAIGWRMKQSAIGSMVALILLAPSAWILRDPPEIIWGCALIALIIARRARKDRSCGDDFGWTAMCRTIKRGKNAGNSMSQCNNEPMSQNSLPVFGSLNHCRRTRAMIAATRGFDQ